MGNHINLPYARDYSRVNFTHSAGLSKPVLINKVFSVKMFPIECFLDCIILMCASVLCHSLWMEPSTVIDRVYSFLKVPVEDISKQNIRATCFHSIIMPLLSQIYLGLVPILFFSLFGNNLRKEKKNPLSHSGVRGDLKLLKHTLLGRYNCFWLRITSIIQKCIQTTFQFSI